MVLVAGVKPVSYTHLTINNESKITFIGKRFTSTSLLIH